MYFSEVFICQDMMYACVPQISDSSLH